MQICDAKCELNLCSIIRFYVRGSLGRGSLGSDPLGLTCEITMRSPESGFNKILFKCGQTSY